MTEQGQNQHRSSTFMVILNLKVSPRIFCAWTGDSWTSFPAYWRCFIPFFKRLLQFGHIFGWEVKHHQEGKRTTSCFLFRYIGLAWLAENWHLFHQEYIFCRSSLQRQFASSKFTFLECVIAIWFHVYVAYLKKMMYVPFSIMAEKLVRWHTYIWFLFSGKQTGLWRAENSEHSEFY